MKNRLLSLLFLSLFCLAGSAEKPKNVLIIFTDDHRFSGVHILGGQQVLTPNIDALAEDGIAFTNTYLMGSITGATCVPSRAMLLTGRNMFELKGEGRHIPEEHTTIGEAFQTAGYDTHIVGKWHQDHASLGRSFDGGSSLMGLGVYMVDHFRMPYWDWNEESSFTRKNAYLLVYDEKGKLKSRALTPDDKRGPTASEEYGPHSSEVFASSAIEYIERRRKKEPFFMYLAFHAPHDPRQAPQQYRDMYPPEDIQLTPSYMPVHPFDNGHLVLRDEELAPWPRTPEIARQHLADYYAIITHLDAQIGKVIEALKKSGEYENTIIVLAGDSGLGVGNHGLLGKQSIYDEDGIHVPFILSGAIQGKGEKIDALAYTYDIFPTVCELADIEKPASVTGLSLVPILHGEKESIRNYTYHAYRQHQRAYRKGDYKLFEFVRAPDFDWKTETEFLSGSRVSLLFHIKEDPWETNNLAFLPEYRTILQEMQAEMREKANELGDCKANFQDRYIPRLSLNYDFWDYYE